MGRKRQNSTNYSLTGVTEDTKRAPSDGAALSWAQTRVMSGAEGESVLSFEGAAVQEPLFRLMRLADGSVETRSA